MEAFLARARALNPRLEVLLTVSPVSLMATATPRQVSVATVYSKSVLRAVAGELCDAHDFIDYFPSYDMIVGPAARGRFYKPGMREVSPAGVACVMRHFFAEHRPPAASPPGTAAQASVLKARPAPGTRPPPDDDAEVKCDEELLDTFGRKPPA